MFIDRKQFFQNNINKEIRVRGCIQQRKVSDLSLLLREYKEQKDTVTIICDFLEENIINFADDYMHSIEESGQRKVITLSSENFTQVESKGRILKSRYIYECDHFNLFVICMDSFLLSSVKNAVMESMACTNFSTDITASCNYWNLAGYSLDEIELQLSLKVLREPNKLFSSDVKTRMSQRNSFWFSKISNSSRSNQEMISLDEVNFPDPEIRTVAIVIDPQRFATAEILQKISDQLKTTAILSTGYSTLSEVQYWPMVHRLSSSWREGKYMERALLKMMRFGTRMFDWRPDGCHVSGFDQIAPKNFMMNMAEQCDRPFVTLDFEKTTSHSAEKHMSSFFDDGCSGNDVFYRIDSPTNLSEYEGFSYLVIHDRKIYKVKSSELSLYKPVYGQELYAKLPKRKRTTGALCFV